MTPMIQAISMQIAGSALSQMPMALQQGFAEMIGKGITTLLTETHDAMIYFNKGESWKQNIGNQSNEVWQETNDIADDIAQAYGSAVPQVLTLAISELVDKGISEARRLARMGLKKLVEQGKLPERLADLDLNEALRWGYMLENMPAHGHLTKCQEHDQIMVNGVVYQWLEPFQSYWPIDGAPRALMQDDLI